MTQQEKRIKLAEAEGWAKTHLPISLKACGDTFCTWTHPRLKPVDNEPGFDPWHAELTLPDYFKCLNAVHELVASLSPEQVVTFAEELSAIVLENSSKAWWDLNANEAAQVSTATAAERAEAIGLALGLWKESAA